MRVLLDEEQIIEVKSIVGNLEEDGRYTLFFEYAYDEPNEGIQFVYEGISADEAKKRATEIIKNALEKGYADCSNEPWDIID